MSWLILAGSILAAFVLVNAGIVVAFGLMAASVAHDDAAVERDARGER